MQGVEICALLLLLRSARKQLSSARVCCRQGFQPALVGEQRALHGVGMRMSQRVRLTQNTTIARNRKKKKHHMKGSHFGKVVSFVLRFCWFPAQLCRQPADRGATQPVSVSLEQAGCPAQMTMTMSPVTWAGEVGSDCVFYFTRLSLLLWPSGFLRGGAVDMV